MALTQPNLWDFHAEFLPPIFSLGFFESFKYFLVMINQTVDTAIQVLIYLSSQDSQRLTALSEIHAVIGGSATYLAKITAQLSKAGLVRSQRGALGGLQMEKAPKKISMLDVVAAVQPGFVPFHIEQCKTKNKLCSYHNTVLRMNESVLATLRKVLLSEMLDNGTKAKGCILQDIKKVEDPRAKRSAPVALKSKIAKKVAPPAKVTKRVGKSSVKKAAKRK